MIKRVQFKFALIAMAAMSFCVIALVVVLNILHMVQTDRQMAQALTEMVETMEAVRSYTQQAEEAENAEPEWRVESYAEEITPEPSPEPTPEPAPSETPQPESAPGGNSGVMPQPGQGKDDIPRGEKQGKQLWWFDFREPSPSESPEPTAEPEETVVNHYYYYYPNNPEKASDLRETAMSQYSGRLCVVAFSGVTEPQVSMSDSNILTEDEAIALAEQMRGNGKDSGYLDDYRYEVTPENGITWVYFLDCATEKDSIRSMLVISCLVGLGGILLSFVFVYFMSRRAIWPLKESMERQKRFVTDAGHELKTPLAVIGSNMDILTMELGENEWVEGTQKQLGRLKKLVTNLISLSKLEEGQEALELQSFPVSEIAQECVDAFSATAELAGKRIEAEIGAGLSVHGDPMTISQLMTILCDNAVKYTEGDPVIHVRLYANGKKVCFETENDWNHTMAPEELSHLFDRFYRGDASRTKTEGQGGYGLGLSIARAIAERNHAQLTVRETDEGRILFRAVFRGER